jgi:hypothetical protein
MKLLILEDNPKAVPAYERLKNREGYDVKIVRTLKDAAGLLEDKPGVDYFDRFIFDAALLNEQVYHVRKGNDEKNGFVQYSDQDGFNGIQFLLNNIDVLGGNAKRPERVAIITAWVGKLRAVPAFIMPDGKTIYKRTELTTSENELLKVNRRTPKIRYLLGDDAYTFSCLDKTVNDILEEIDKFLFNG